MGRGDSPHTEFVLGMRDHVPTPKEILHEGGWYEGVAELYLMVMRSIRKVFDTTEDKEQRKRFGVIWSMLRDTNLFAIPDLLYNAFYEESKQYVKDMLKHQGFHGADDMSSMTDDSLNAFISAGQQVEMPEKLPFPSCYFGYDPPMEIEEEDWWGFELDELGVEIIRAFVIGHLVTRNRSYVFLMIENEGFGVVPMVIRQKGEWQAMNHYEPWVLVSMLEWINDHMTVVEEDSATRRRFLDQYRSFERALKLKKTPPPPYYTVYMRDSYKRQINTVYQRRRKTKPEWNHRWAVRGHHLVRIRRGALPMDGALREKLIDRRYRVFTNDPPDAETAQHLARRRVPGKKADEWMAVLISWRSDHVKGPEWAPFIPATRKSARITKVEKDAMKRAMRP
ncbi:MAG TPA: hypothetical protein VLA34_00395, partial [Candidatus Krumholzibacterium sp.]|nr:hypothetical protein [Candidatus Krumholzibacterium sp.]